VFIAQFQTFSRCGTGLKMRFHPLPELKIDMFKTSIGSCQRLRRWQNFRCFVRLVCLRFIVFILCLPSVVEEEYSEDA